ncbi:Large extracellular alpha-helical protein [Minicystis rosea]|nr:Large extracellular alpha-helical protein [Minicystis rosea]
MAARGPRIAPVVLTLVTLGVSCLQGARPPSVAPRGTLSPGDGEAGLAKREGPFGVVFASPKGQTVDPSEITLVWNRPMRALEVAGQETPPPIVMKPQVPGHWIWVGTTGLSFNPEGQLPRATEITVEVPAGTRALDGSVMEKPYVLRFSTARPKLESVSADPGGRDSLEPSSKLVLRFNQPVDEAEIARSVKLTVEPARGRQEAPLPVAFTVRRPDPKNEQLAQIVPSTPLPLDSAVHLVADAGLRGREGPLLANEPARFDFRTYGPLVVERLECSNDGPRGLCTVDGGFSLELSGAVKFGDLKKALRIDPPVKVRWPAWLDDAQPTTSISAWGRFVPGRSYRVSVAGLRDTHGQTLARAFTKNVAFDDLWPAAAIGLRGDMLEPAARRGIPVATVNVKDLELATAPLDEATVIALETDAHAPGREPRIDDLQKLRGAKVETLHPSGGANRPATHLVSPDDVLGGKDRRGPVGIALSFVDRPGTSRARSAARGVVAQVTDLAISAKVSGHGSLIWVTRLGSAAPVEGARVSIARPDGSRADGFVTDKNGFVVVPESAWSATREMLDRSVILARLGDDWTYRRAGDLLSGYRHGVSINLGPDLPFGMLFTDRGIYRPGDTVHIKGMFRQEAARGLVTPAGRTVDLVFETPDGEAFSRQSVALSAFGTLAVDLKVPDTGRLGTYSMRATVQGSPRDYADASSDFEVAEYRPAEFKVGVQSDRSTYARGDKASWTARGDYLFGAPMSGAEAWLRVTRAQTSFTPPGLEGFVTDDETFFAGKPNDGEGRYEVQNDHTKLDAKGTATIAATLALPGQRGPELVTCEADVTDLSRQTIAGSTSALVHPGDFYVALKPSADLFVKASDPVKPEVLAVEPKGTKVSGVAVTVELLQRRWSVARQAVGGGFRTTTEIQDRVVSSCTATTGTQPAACAVQPSGPGYYLVRASAKDRRGNVIAASTGLYATSEAGETSWPDNDTSKVELVADRKSYEVGQTARVLVKSPFKSAEALVTVERGGVYSQRRITLTGPMPTVEVPITDDLRPNAFVSVLLLRGRSKAPPAKLGAPDVGAPAFRLGYASLPINPEARRLSVAVKPGKTELRPGDTLEVDVEVKDRAGKPARGEVTLYAVDEGVLSLIGYKTPDPVSTFGAPQALRVATLEARASLAKVQNPLADLGIDKGLDGGGGGGDNGVRRDFRASAYWGPALATDAAGRVHASFKLPDSLTTYRVMAVVASEDDRFGYGEDRVVASRPLMARPAFPRFMRAGDAIEAGVVLTSKGLARSRIDVEITADGVTVKGEPKQAVDLDAGGSAEVRFALEAPRAGTAKIGFRAHGGGAEDRVEITREIKVPLVLEAAALYGDTTHEAAEKLGDLSAIRDDTGGLDVSLASTALVGLGSGMEQLVQYPYGCTEQLTSRLVPLLPLRDLARDYKVEMPKDLDVTVARTVAEILTHQRSDGGFGMWAASDQSSPWITAYALWGLTIAKQRGVTLSDQSLKSATQYLRDNLGNLEKNEILFASAPFILDVLAEAGQPDPGRVARVFERREKLPLFAQAQLLHAMVLSKSDPKSIDSAVSELEGNVRLDGNVARVATNTGDHYAVLMDSDTRTSALVLRALLAARPEHAMAARLAMGLLGARKGGTWRNTQETAWSLLALDDYRKVQEKTEPDFVAHVFIGEAEIQSATFRGRSFEQPRAKVPAARLVAMAGAPLGFTVEGQGRLFYEARLRYAKKTLPKDALERGFYVKKTLRAVKPEALAEALKLVPDASARAFRGGDLVLGDVVVVTPSPRAFVVIDEPLPAGFEAVDARLATTGASVDVDRAAAQSGTDDDGDDDEIAAGGAYRPSHFVREIRDDRVLFFVDHMGAGMFHYRYLARATSLGTFVLPPTKVEEMYTPEVFGRTGADSIRVVAK